MPKKTAPIKPLVQQTWSPSSRDSVEWSPVRPGRPKRVLEPRVFLHVQLSKELVDKFDALCVIDELTRTAGLTKAVELWCANFKF